MKERRAIRPLAVSIQQAAIILSVSEHTIRNWIVCGDLKAVRYGKKLWRIPRVELAKLRAERESC